MTYYAVIDTNVLVSAFLSSHETAATVQVVSMLFSVDVIPIFSDDILAEYNEVLHRKKQPHHCNCQRFFNHSRSITIFSCLNIIRTDNFTV